jgi:hypothetical protein
MLTLYRGEYPHLLSSLLGDGISFEARLRVTGLSLEDQQRIKDERLMLVNSMPESVPIKDSTATIIKSHVAQYRRSPFVSFSGKHEVALCYATKGGERNDGLLITAEIKGGQEIAFVPFQATGLFIDHLDRLWIWMPAFKHMFKTEILCCPKTARAFRLALRDDEYLLLGDLSYPDDYKIAKV